MKLRGLEFNTKIKLFSREYLYDCYLILIEITLIAASILLYSKDTFLTFFTIFGMTCAIGLAFFIYSASFVFDILQFKVILRITFFPFLNMIAVIITFAVGVDDAFIFVHNFRRARLVS